MDSRVQPHFTYRLLFHPVSQQLQTPRTSKYFNLSHKIDVLQNEQNGFCNLQGRYHQVHNEPELSFPVPLLGSEAESWKQITPLQVLSLCLISSPLKAKSTCGCVRSQPHEPLCKEKVDLRITGCSRKISNF